MDCAVYWSALLCPGAIMYDATQWHAKACKGRRGGGVVGYPSHLIYIEVGRYLTLSLLGSSRKERAYIEREGVLRATFKRASERVSACYLIFCTYIII